MVTYAKHLQKVLLQALDSYIILSDIDGTPLGIEDIRRELLKINGLFKAMISNIPESSVTLSDYKALCSKVSRYLAEYDFERELEIMEPTYSEDVMRINNVRIKILEALNDKRMVESIREVTDQL